MNNLGGAITPTGRLMAEKIVTPHTDQLHVSENAVAVLRREESITALRVREDHSQSLAVDLTSDGGVALQVTGPPSTGEDSVPRVSGVLVQRLRLDGIAWSEPEILTGARGRDERGIDAQATAPGGLVLQIQVVRADPTQTFWRALAGTGAVERRFSLIDLATGLRAAVALKADQMTLAQRAPLTLALDATIVASHSFAAAIDAFRTAHGAWVRALGFTSVWSVGPSVSLTWRLDQ